MRKLNDLMVIQLSQLGQIENLEDKVCVLEGKLAAQDTLIDNLVSDNLDHLQANMQLTAHINRSEDWWRSNKVQLQSIEGLVHEMRRVLYSPCFGCYLIPYFPHLLPLTL